MLVTERNKVVSRITAERTAGSAIAPKGKGKGKWEGHRRQRGPNFIRRRAVAAKKELQQEIAETVSRKPLEKKKRSKESRVPRSRQGKASFPFRDRGPIGKVRKRKARCQALRGGPLLQKKNFGGNHSIDWPIETTRP